MSFLGPTCKCLKRQVRTLDQALEALAARTRTFGPRHCYDIGALDRNWDKSFPSFLFFGLFAGGPPHRAEKNRVGHWHFLQTSGNIELLIVTVTVLEG